jgi:hypothetical protein
MNGRPTSGPTRGCRAWGPPYSPRARLKPITTDASIFGSALARSDRASLSLAAHDDLFAGADLFQVLRQMVPEIGDTCFASSIGSR